MKIALVLCLLFAQTAYAKERTVALVFADRTEIVTLTKAEREYKQLRRLKNRTLEQEKRFAAIVQATGIQETRRRLHPSEAERERWQRQPLQNPLAEYK